MDPVGNGGSFSMWDAHPALSVQLKFKALKLTTIAVLQRRFRSPFVFREEDPTRQVSPGMGGDRILGKSLRVEGARSRKTRCSCGRSQDPILESSDSTGKTEPRPRCRIPKWRGTQHSPKKKGVHNSQRKGAQHSQRNECSAFPKEGVLIIPKKMGVHNSQRNGCS